MLHSQPGSQSAFAAIGGYSVPFFSTFGVQVHQESLSILSMTMGTWEPQPHQEDFSARAIRSSGMGRGSGSLTAGGAGSGFAHLEYGFMWIVGKG